MLLVVLYHAGVGTLSGGFAGVDVFFVISGFLITTHLLESLEAEGRISFGRFYAKRARRILPASLLVAALTVVAAWLWMPPLLMSEVAEGAVATALYLPNILFAIDGTDYLAETSPSVFQHYWSLGIEEQFYLFWPALLALGFWLCRRSERRLLWVTAALTLASFLACVLWMGVSPSWTFFSLPTRARELGAGALTAFLLRTGPPAAPAGDGLLRGSGWRPSRHGPAVRRSTPFPGTRRAAGARHRALIVGGGARALHANRAEPATLPVLRRDLVLALPRPLAFQVIPQVAVGRTIRAALGISCSQRSPSLAWLLFRFVERPRDRLAVAGAPPADRCAAAPRRWSHATAGAVHVGAPSRTRPPTAPRRRSATSRRPGGHRLSREPPASSTGGFRQPSIYDDGCHRSRAARIQRMREIPTPGVPVRRLHAASWYPALAELAEQGRIRLDTNTKSSCPSADLPLLLEGVEYTECAQWRAGVLERIGQEQPDLVLLANYGASEPELEGETDDFAARWQTGMESTIEAIDGPEVAVLADVPHDPETPAVCLSDELENAGECATPISSAFDPRIVRAERAAAEATGADYLDLTPYLCNDETCPVIIGDLLVYRDGHHLTATFSTKLAPPLWEELRPVLK